MKIRKSNMPTKRNSSELRSGQSSSTDQMKMSTMRTNSNIHGKRRANHSTSSWTRAVSIGVLLQILVNCGLSSASIRVSLQVDPPSVRRGQMVTFICTYDLQGAPLYSVKFYRGVFEFYRYSPSEVPTGKIFPFPGFNVDLLMSNASQVVLRNVGFGLSGDFSCEVTADAPSFSTSTAYIQMQVVELPATKPILWTERDRYESGDMLVANCSSPPSQPRVELKLSINNFVQYSAQEKFFPMPHNLVKTNISLRLVLQNSHFHGVSPATTNGLTLKCIAEIPNLFHETSEVELGTPQRDPVPARVTSSSASLPNRTIAAVATVSTVIISLGMTLFQRILFTH